MSGTISGMGGPTRPNVVSGASGRQTSSMKQRLSNVFDSIDKGGSGTISKAHFTDAFQSLSMPPSVKKQGADAVYNQLDPNGAGSINKDDFIAGVKKMISASHSQNGKGHGNTDSGKGGGRPSRAQA